MAKARTPTNVTKFPVAVAAKGTVKAAPAKVAPVKAAVKPAEKEKVAPKVKSLRMTEILKATKPTAGTYVFGACDAKGNMLEREVTAVPQLYVRKAKHTVEPAYVLLTLQTFATLKELQAAQDEA